MNFFHNILIYWDAPVYINSICLEMEVFCNIVYVLTVILKY